MGKVWKPKGDKPTPNEIRGRALAGFADTPQEEYQAYQKAMGPENVKHDNYVQALPPIRVNRRGKWVEPDDGLDLADFTTDQLPQIPSIVGGIAGFSVAGSQGAVGGAMLGEGMRRKIGQQLGVGDGSINPTAMKIAGAGEALGPLVAALPLPNIPALTAYHGSPHVFDKFDMSKIGTGEGHQAYGRGLYFAQSPEVAGVYQKNVKDMSSVKKINQRIAELNKIIEGNSVGYRKFRSDVGKNAAKEYDELLAARDNVREAQGNLYTVDIPDEHIDRMLDWDKPLIEQSDRIIEYMGVPLDSVKRYRAIVGKTNTMSQRGMLDTPEWDALLSEARAIREAHPAIGMTGGEVYRLSHERMIKTGKALPAAVKEKMLVESMRKSGIPGIKYLDGTSRTAGEGSRNFVLFDDSIPKIIDRKRAD